MSGINLDFNESSLSSCSSSPPTSVKQLDSSCTSDDDPTLALKINKGLSMGYDYELIKSVIQQQNDGDDMSKFIETIVRTAEMNNTSLTPIINENDSSEISHDIFVIDGVDLAYSCGNNSFSWHRIEICLKYLHTHGHKKVSVILPYSLKHHRYEQNFSESKILRDLERKNLLIYTNRILKQSTKPNSYTHINEMLKYSQKTRGYLITNVSLKDIILDFTKYKQILEEKIIRYRFQNDQTNFSFQPLLVTIINDENGNDCEIYYPLCPYGKKCTYGLKCKYFHIERRQQKSFSVSESLQMKAQIEKSRIHYGENIFQGFNQTKSGPDHLHMYASSLVDDANMSYEYGLTSTPISNDFSFTDQRSLSNPSFLNRPYSMSQQEFNPIQQNQYDYSTVNSQQGLADKIQAVRHLWETESSSTSSNYSNIYNPMQQFPYR